MSRIYRRVTRANQNMSNTFKSNRADKLSSHIVINGNQQLRKVVVRVTAKCYFFGYNRNKIRIYEWR